jgi:prepilin-type N-terminal cleavage/methylation domain-containing protein
MKRRAFTLIELAISLTVIGLVIGGSFQAIKAMRERNSISEAKDAVKAAKDAVIGDALAFGNLGSSANFDQNLSPLKAILVSGNLKRSLFYFHDTALEGIEAICSQTTTNLSVVDNGVSPVRTITDVAFVLAHESANRNIQTNIDTSVTPNVVNIYGRSTAVDDNTNVPNINRVSDEYDDIVKWVTLDELKRILECKRPSILNTSLPDDFNNTTSYNAQIFFDGNSTSPLGSCIYTPTSVNYTNANNYIISNSGSTNSAGTVLVNCNYQDGTVDINKSFTITIHPR